MTSKSGVQTNKTFVISSAVRVHISFPRPLLATVICISMIIEARECYLQMTEKTVGGVANA